MKKSNNNTTKTKKNLNSTKKKWTTPILLELDIERGTKGNTQGPSTFDGGGFISDYRS